MQAAFFETSTLPSVVFRPKQRPVVWVVCPREKAAPSRPICHLVTSFSARKHCDVNDVIGTSNEALYAYKTCTLPHRLLPSCQRAESMFFDFSTGDPKKTSFFIKAIGSLERVNYVAGVP